MKDFYRFEIWTKKKKVEKKKLIMINITIVSKIYKEQNLING